MLMELEVKNTKIQTLEEDILKKNNTIERLLQTIN